MMCIFVNRNENACEILNELDEGENLEEENDIVERNKEPLTFSKALDYVTALQTFANEQGIVSVMDKLSEVSSILERKYLQNQAKETDYFSLEQL